MLTPVAVLPRAALPLAYLDTFGGSGLDSASGRTRLFSAYIVVLENADGSKIENGGLGSKGKEKWHTAASVLIAHAEVGQSFYVVERVKKGVYALCKLGQWVQKKDVEALVDGYGELPTEVLIGAFSGQEDDTNTQSGNAPWWQGATIADHAIPKDWKEHQRSGPRLCMARPAGLAPVTITAATQQEMQTQDLEELKVESNELPEIIEPPEMNEPEEQPLSAQQVLEALVTQYLDALYLSKTSLAYFAKGPLSRARAAFSSTDNPSMQLHELSTFLRTAILSPKMADQKWREKVPEIVKAIPATSYSDDEQAVPQKRSKSKKLKLSKYGMFPAEEEYVKRWWKEEISQRFTDEGEEVGETLLKKRQANVRVRESFVQLIIVLEIMALEASPNFKPPGGLDVLDEKIHASGPESASKKPRRKKVQDLNLVADLLVDKLCIWQSLEGDMGIDFTASANTNKGAASNKPDGVGENDRLRNFCIEVIIPL